MSCSYESVQHETDGGDIDHSFRTLHGVFMIFAKAAIAAEPSERSFHNPRQTGDLEGSLSPLHVR